MTFDIIVGNPPYQENSEGESTFLKPIYHNFIEKSLKLGTKNLFLVPSRWMQGGKGLDDFRKNIMSNNIVKYVTDYQYSSTIFPMIWLDGGISYSLLDNNHNGKVKYTYIDKNNKQFISERYINEGNYDFIIRDIRQLKIINKAKQFNEITFDKLVSKRDPYGFATDLFNRPECYKEADLSKNYKEHYIKIYGVEGGKNAVRVSGYINKESVRQHKDWINQYNIFFSYAYNMRSVTPPKQILSIPGELCTGTFLNIGPFKYIEEQLNCHKYMQTKFFRALLFFHRFQKNTIHTTFEFIPIQDFNINWTDEMLYKKYNLDKNDIEYIENLVIK